MSDSASEPKPKKRRRRRFRGKRQDTPGCECSRCLRARERQARGTDPPAERPPSPFNAGPVQRDPLWQAPRGTPGKWSDHGSEPDKGSEHPFLRPSEVQDREDRVAHGRTLQAAYRYLLGPTPDLTKVGPITRAETAKSFLHKIEEAIERSGEHGGWTRSEWTRLCRLREIWRRRASGTDVKFNLYGNRGGILTRDEANRLNDRKVLSDIKELLDGPTHQTGRGR